MSAQPPKTTKMVKSTYTYDAAMIFWRMITQVFFREIRPRGAYNIPREGPVIFVGAPHNNQFLDPLLLSLEVFKETRRHVQFLTAAKSMERKAVGFFARTMDSIPVARAADAAKTGKGRIWIAHDDPLTIYGEGTEFTKVLKPRMQLMLSKSLNSMVAEVSEVVSDTEVKIKREFGGESGKGTSRIREKIAEAEKDGMKGLDYKTLPFVDQQEMYRHVFQCLTEGGSIGIFPEGGSHDRTDLLPLKAGVSIMALGAMANDPNVKVKIVPVGLAYFHAHRFRSRAVVEFGNALDVPQEYVEMFKLGGEKKKEAVGKFLDLIYDGLKTVTVRAPDYDTLMLIQAARRLYKTPGQHLTLGQVVELNRRLLEGYSHFKDEPRVQKLRENVLKYNRLLRDLGLRDHQVPKAKKAGWKNLEALAASTVKIAGRDVLATWKILICLGVAPVLYITYAVLATIVMARAGAPTKLKIATPILVFIALPFMNYAALKFGEAGMDVLKSLRPLIVSLVPGQQRSLDRAKALRVQLSNEVVSLINDFGPKLYSDFDEWRILVPSSDAPPSTGTPGLWRRKSSTGAVDAQGLGLIHPMTWIDERLFGWSRSANRGTSAWSGYDDASRIGTPEETDDEDHGDYDHVVGVLDGVGPKPKSRTSSYADLQKLRQGQATHPMVHSHLSESYQPPKYSDDEHADGDKDGGLRLRGPRARRESLSDRVPVGRIAAVDKKEAFPSATHDLNDEMDKSKTK